MNLEQAKRVSKKGAYTAFLLAGIGFIVFTYYIFVAHGSNPTPRSKLYGDPLYYLSALIYIILGFSLLKFSRVAAIALFALCFLIFAKLMGGHFTSFGPMGILFIGVITYFFGNALRGTFTYHSLRRKEDPHYRRTPKWQYFLGIPIGLFFLVGSVWQIMGVMGTVPSMEVLSGTQLNDKNKDLLRQEGILLKNEKIDFFYSEGFLSILEGGNILTDKRVISYQTLNEELDISALNLEDITEYTLIEKGDFLNDTTILVYDKAGNSIFLLLSTEKNGDEKFIEALSKRIKPFKQKEKST